MSSGVLRSIRDRPRIRKGVLGCCVAVLTLGLAGSLRRPSNYWAEELERYLSRTLGLPVVVSSFSTSFLMPSVAKGIVVKNEGPFERLGPMAQVNEVVLYHRLLPRLLGRLEIQGIRAAGVDIRLARLPDVGWNIENLDTNALRAASTDKDQRVDNQREKEKKCLLKPGAYSALRSCTCHFFKWLLGKNRPVNNIFTIT